MLIWGGGFPEPLDYPQDFSANNIMVTWTEATGNPLPDGYLVRMSTIGFGDIADPVDGIPAGNDPANQNVPYGTGRCFFDNPGPGNTCYIKIFPYRGSGGTINYKVDSNVVQISFEID
jgi:hypothetical protein